MTSKLIFNITTFCLLSGILFLPEISWGDNGQSQMNAELASQYKAASPLNHTVEITRSGSVLKLDYQLMGTDGKVYDLWKINNDSRPRFTIYQDNVKIADGDFAFG